MFRFSVFAGKPLEGYDCTEVCKFLAWSCICLQCPRVCFSFVFPIQDRKTTFKCDRRVLHFFYFWAKFHHRFHLTETHYIVLVHNGNFFHAIPLIGSSLISKMAYEKSVINININFDNEDQPVPHLPKPFLPRKDRGKDKIAMIQPSVEAQRTAVEIQRRVQELQKFRRESQSAVEAPLLVTALIKKTHQRLDNIEVSTLQQLINSQIFF